VSKVPVYHLTRGSGPVLLLMLGGAADADTAGAFVDCLSHAFTVITYNRRGQARSPLERPDKRIEIETHSGDAHELLAALSDEPAYVFGSSIGALIAARPRAPVPLPGQHPGRPRATAQPAAARSRAPDHEPG